MHKCMFNYQRAKLKKKTRKTKQSIVPNRKDVFRSKYAIKIRHFCKSYKRLTQTALVKCKFGFLLKKTR